MDLKIFLKNLPAFEEFAPTQLDVLASCLTVDTHEDGHVFIRQGQQGEALYLLMQGAVTVTRRDADNGEDAVVRELRGGELFGVLSLVSDMPASATCTGHGTTKTAALTREAFDRLFHEASPIGHHLQFMVAGQLARDLRETNRTLRAALAQG